MAVLTYKLCVVILHLHSYLLAQAHVLKALLLHVIMALLVLVATLSWCFDAADALAWHHHHHHHDDDDTTTTTTVMQIPANVSVMPVNKHLLDSQCNWGGMNSYFLYAQDEKDQNKTLLAMQQWGLKVLRIFVDARTSDQRSSHVSVNFSAFFSCPTFLSFDSQQLLQVVPANHKGAKNPAVGFLEPEKMGPPYKTHVLDLINKLMVRAHAHGVKLAIVMHDRYSLGCWACDGYQKALGLTCVPDEKPKKCGPDVSLGSPTTWTALSSLNLNHSRNGLETLASEKKPANCIQLPAI